MAKKRRLITRRRLKWVAIFLTMCVLVLSVASAWHVIRYTQKNSKSGTYVGIGFGAVSCGWYRNNNSAMTYGFYWPDGLTHETTDPKRIRWLPNWRDYGVRGAASSWRTYIDVPLWPLLVLLTPLSVWLWHADRRAKPWQCANCRYDLRGLVGESKTTTCPECGTTSNR